MKGFTLIEMVMYMGIFSLILIIVLPSFYFVSASVDREKTLMLESEEMNFILAKVDRLISDSAEIIEPLPNQTRDILKLNLARLPSEQVTIGLEENSIYIQRGLGGTREKINSDRVKISNLNFEHVPENQYRRSAVSFSFQINSHSVPTSTLQISRRNL